MRPCARRGEERLVLAQMHTQVFAEQPNAGQSMRQVGRWQEVNRAVYDHVESDDDRWRRWLHDPGGRVDDELEAFAAILLRLVHRDGTGHLRRVRPVQRSGRLDCRPEDGERPVDQLGVGVEHMVRVLGRQGGVDRPERRADHLVSRGEPVVVKLIAKSFEFSAPCTISPLFGRPSQWSQSLGAIYSPSTA
jgi:hypothetical protein